ncbi:MAG: hypothetical protein HEEMFOPI_01954 [Holosporales bacterium]
MKFKKIFLLGAYTFSLSFSNISQLYGSGIIAETSSMLMRRMTYVSTVAQSACQHLYAHNNIYTPVRFVKSTTITTQFKSPHEFAKATTDISFKQLLDPTKDKDVIISFLNTFVPQFSEDPVKDIEPASVVIPTLPRDGDRKEKATFMDLHVKSKSGISYIIEMQARRHIYFDERVLFYLCNTYGRQLSEAQMNSHDWYRSLKPTIALQVLDYDSNRIHGITDGKIEDTQVKRVKDHPLPKDDYIKHFFMTDNHSKQQLDHIQMIQVELPRYVKRALFPPQKDFTPVEWWLSILRHSSEYTQKYIDQLASNGILMPDTVKIAFNRLDFSKWNPDQRREYALQVEDREEFEATYAVERAEGFKEGIEKGLQEGIEKGLQEGERKKAIETAKNLKSMGLTLEQIAAATGLSLDDLKVL